MTRARLQLVAIAMLLGILLVPRFALADNVDSLVRELDADSERVRLSAVLNLTKLGDARGIEPLVKTLTNDSDKKVRSAAAVGLGIIAASASKALKAKAVAALQKAASGDASELVKAQSEKSLKTLGAATGGSNTTSSGGGGSIYVNIGPMSSKTGNAAADPKLRTLMLKTATSTLTKVASTMQTSWPGGVPTKSQLATKGFQGFYVDGTLNELKVQTSGNTATITCKINMLLASFPDKSVFGFLNGGAKVQGSASQKDVDLAGEDCVAAVVEDLIAKKIVPTINTKASNP